MPSRSSRLCVAAVTLLSLVVSASVVKFETIDDMARRVPVIVRGRVLRSVAGWDEQKRRIWTWTEVAVTESIKGKTGGIVLVKQPGGEVADIGQAVAGVATFREGEDCVLFLQPSPEEPTAYRTANLAAGKVTITELRGQPAVVRNTDGLAFAVPNGQKVAKVPSPEFLGTPDAFVAHLRAIAGGAK